MPEDRGALLRALGPAIYLHDFLVQRQTNARGWVNRGQPINYEWIRENWPGAWETRPSIRTLKRWMARLKDAGEVEVRLERFNAAMRVRLARSVKFAPDERRAPEQLALLGGPVAFPRRVEKAVENPVEKPVETVAPRGDKSGTSVGTKVAPHPSKKNSEEKILNPARAVTARGEQPAPNGGASSTPHSISKSQRRYGETRRLIEQATRVLARDAANGRPGGRADLAEDLKRFAAAAGFDYDGQMVATAIDIAERRLRDGPEGGWQDARAG